METNDGVYSRDLQGAEVSWFAPICDGDDRYLGQRDPQYKSTWKNTSEVVLAADRAGFRNILCPSSYQVGQDTLPFVASLSPLTKNINLLAAIRSGEIHPAMLGRTLATLDHLLEGRLTLNIISSNLPGEDLSSAARYQRSREVIQILKQAWTQDRIEFQGEFYQLSLDAKPAKPFQKDGPLLYFGGYSPPALDLCAEFCDVYLMWPDTRPKLKAQLEVMQKKAGEFGRCLDYGLRVHVVVRETETEAREYAQSLVSKLDDDQGEALRNRALDAKSLGVSKQQAVRESADTEGYAEELLFAGIGRARSGCGAALVGSAEQIIERIKEYQAMGFRSFIFSGYPHLSECAYFARLVLPYLDTVSLPQVYGKVPEEPPFTPLGKASRI